MSEVKTFILTHDEIERKLQRMAWEIYENNHLTSRLILIGIADNGFHLATAISKILVEISGKEIITGRIDFNKPDGFNASPILDCAVSLHNETVIMVDDVLNSGKTMLVAMLPVLNNKPSKLQTAVLANRNHKAFPVKGDIVGISLATTLQEHIWFQIDGNQKMSIYLD